MKTITVLHQLLMESELEQLLAYLTKLNVKYTITGNQTENKYTCRLFKDGMLEYRGASGTSVKSAICDALCKFLHNEKKDYHSYMEKQ